MADPGTDDKIARLVHSVLEAVDARLAEVRHEVLVLGEELGLKHLQVKQQIDELSQRVDRLNSVPTTGEPRTAAGDEVTQVLLEQVEATQRRYAERTEQRLAQLDAAISQLRTGPAAAPQASAVDPGPSLTPSLPSFAQVSAPLLTTPPTVDLPPRAEVTGEHKVIQEGEQIDLDRLTDLLTQRLGQLDLPHAQ